MRPLDRNPINDPQITLIHPPKKCQKTQEFQLFIILAKTDEPVADLVHDAQALRKSH